MSQPRILNLIDDVQSMIDSCLKGDTEQKQSISSPPSAATVTETIILNYKIDNVWNIIKDCTFEFSSIVKSCEILPDKSATASVGTSRKLNYNDGTAQMIQINEISALQKKISYSMISSEPSVSYTSATHSIKLLEITCPGNQTFVEYKSTFSNDASLQVIQDSRFKKKEAFKDMEFALSSIK
mmetsp:Transcript_56928/g.51219  ORF Transcript_56928/g.51219 Transcript_56928/m.51219 type:complete len:183 (-) Transcript_56928:114-662(-)